jgi:hypothetical protein
LFVNKYPFFFRIHSKTDPEKQVPDYDYFSTEQSTLNMFLMDMNIYTVQYPSSNAYNDQFFGLGERKGDFFL